MLTQLHISNYALIDDLEIDFKNGLTIITGETGAGKSIIMGALSLILGERAESRAVRDIEKKVVVEATFDITKYQLSSFFLENDIEYFETECILRREINSNGRSRTFVNDTPVTVSVLKELSTRLIDIHSQHSNMLLSKPQFQLSIIDNIARNQQLLLEYRKEYTSLKELQANLQSLKEECQKKKTEEDYIRFQLKQLQELKLKENEDVELESAQKRLSNIAETKENLWSALSVLNGEDHSIIEQLSMISSNLRATEKNLEEIEGIGERVRSAMIELKDISQTLSAIDDRLVDDPSKLEEIDERLNDIYALERKHNAESVNELLKIQDYFANQLSSIENSDTAIAELEQQVKEKLLVVQSRAEKLSHSRKAAAKSFISELKPIAKELGMHNLEFNIGFSDTDFTNNGSDAIEFLFAFNKNQALLPVKNTASGGEISRLMLCIKSIIANNMNLPTIIFDEVDTGVSGDIANKIGEMMGNIAQRIQVIAITHLPQVAAHSNQHLMVYKSDRDDSTYTHVKILNNEEHTMEVARMLSGKGVNQAAINNAKSLIELSK